MSTNENISSFAIYPGVGLSRVGNSDEYYLTSDIPGVPAIPSGGYKDEQGRIKKQVARFRVYGLDEKGNVIKEVTPCDTDVVIKWRVHLANRKGAWYDYFMPMDLPEAQAVWIRNKLIPEKDRNSLVIDPGSRTISGTNESGPSYHFDSGSFLNVEHIALGEIRTDDYGRLLVFGGSGEAQSLLGSGVNSPTDNNGWYDTTSDGTVRASIIFNGTTYEAKPSVVIVAPPNFGQGLYGPITGLDLLHDLYVKNEWICAETTPSFTRDIYPIFKRLSMLQWVSSAALMLFGSGSFTNFLDPKMIKKLADKSDSNRDWRMEMLAWFRNPQANDQELQKQLPYYSDTIELMLNPSTIDETRNLALLPLQYSYLEQWAAGNFIDDSLKVNQPLNEFDSLSAEAQTIALNNASMTEALGGPFVPGIEITWIFRQITMWESPFRLKLLPEGVSVQDYFGAQLTPAATMDAKQILHATGPGTLTRWMGIPWQSDTSGCRPSMNNVHFLPLPLFWAARVPTNVLAATSFEYMTDQNQSDLQIVKYFAYRQSWYRGLGGTFREESKNLIDEWYKQGVVRPVASPDLPQMNQFPTTFLVESERTDGPKDDYTIKMLKDSEQLAPPDYVKKEKEVLNPLQIKANKAKRRR